jgi:hypothetical protein
MYLLALSAAFVVTPDRKVSAFAGTLRQSFFNAST